MSLNWTRSWKIWRSNFHQFHCLLRQCDRPPALGIHTRDLCSLLLPYQRKGVMGRVAYLWFLWQPHVVVVLNPLLCRWILLHHWKPLRTGCKHLSIISGWKLINIKFFGWSNTASLLKHNRVKNVFVAPPLTPLKDSGADVMMILSDDEGTPTRNQQLTPTLKSPLDLNLIVQALQMYQKMSFGWSLANLFINSHCLASELLFSQGFLLWRKNINRETSLNKKKLPVYIPTTFGLMNALYPTDAKDGWPTSSRCKSKQHHWRRRRFRAKRKEWC